MSRRRRRSTYHGRTCSRVVHLTKTSNREYIMVRAKGGGTKRLYLTARGKVPVKHKQKP